MRIHCILYFHIPLELFHYISEIVYFGVPEHCMRIDEKVALFYTWRKMAYDQVFDYVKPKLPFNHSLYQLNIYIIQHMSFASLEINFITFY